MAEGQSAEKHHKWGRNIAHYPQLFTKEALAALLEAPDDDIKRGIERRVALHAIQRICALGDPNLNQYSRDSLISYITLEKLACILETARFAGELASFALPRLVAGCIVLMSSVEPSPFYYEYGYMCFKIMVAALTTCLLKQTIRSETPCNLVNKSSPNDCLSTLWEAYPAAFIADLATKVTGDPKRRGLTPLQPWTSTLLEKPRFDTLLTLLDADLKNFTTALKDTGSMGLFGLMRVLWQYTETEEANMKQGDYEEKLLLPYTRIFNRYRLVVPNLGLESGYIGGVYRPYPSIAHRASEFIDLEDSMSIIQAYSKCLSSYNYVQLDESICLATFLEPLVVSGCEGLICDMFDASMTNLWNLLPDSGSKPSTLLMALCNVLLRLQLIIQKLEPSCADDRSWILRVMDRAIYDDVAGLIFRATLMLPPASDDSDLEGEIANKSLLETMKCFVTLLVTYTPSQYRKNLLRDSGTLSDWRKYLFHFSSYGAIEPTNPKRRLHQICNYSLLEIWQILMGDGWECELSAVGDGKRGICSNPRCPSPFGAEFADSTRTNGPYCSTRCHALVSIYAPQPHNGGVILRGRVLRPLINPL